MILVDGADPLFATRPVAEGYEAAPTVVVGLPRSGTSFLAYVLSGIRDWYIFDDLYLRRTAIGMGADGPLTASQLDRLLDFLSWQIRARIKWETDFPKPQCTLEDVDRMEAALRATYASSAPTWPELQREWLMRLALRHGKTRWGYKAPQDFMNIDELAAIYPGARFVFCIRDPRRMMASFKFLSGEDGTKRQYHPVVYARYWAMAVRAYEQALAQGVPCFLVQFEELRSNPVGMAHRLAEFLDSSVDESALPSGANTSFRSGQRSEITPTEAWICERMAAPEMARLDYALDHSAPRLGDLPDFLETTARFAGYQLWRAATNPGARVAIAQYVKRMAR